MLEALLLVVFAAACGTAGLAALMPGLGARLGAARRWWRHSRGAALPKLGDAPRGDVFIEGVLAAASGPGQAVLATAVPPPDAAGVPGENAVNAAAPEVRVEMPDGIVLLTGEVVVVSGACEVLPGHAPAAVARRLGDLAGDLCATNWQVRCLRAGDRVRAAGRLESAPDLDGPAGYRTRAARYRLSGAAPSNRVIVHSARLPRPFVAPRRRYIAACGGAVLGAVLAVIGLSSMQEEIAVAPLPQAPSLAAGLMDSFRYDEACAVGESTNDYDIAATACFLAADLPAAARMFTLARTRRPQKEPSYNELDAYIAAHRWADAAAIADGLAERQGDKAMGAELKCFAETLRLKGDASKPRPSDTPRELFIEATFLSVRKQGLCYQTLAELTRSPRVEAQLGAYVESMNFGMMRPGPPGPPLNYAGEIRVSALLLRESDSLKSSWPFELPHGTHALRANSLLYRMPLFALEESAARRTTKFDHAERVDRAVLMAVWYSYLGEHEEAARELYDAFVFADLAAAAPVSLGRPGHLFDAPQLYSLMNHKSALFPPHWTTQLFTVAAALALRAGEVNFAAAYNDLVKEEDDPSEVRRYIRAASRKGPDPLQHLRDRDWPEGRAFLGAADKDSPSLLLAALINSDGQGLWPVVGPRLNMSREAALSWARGAGPFQCGDCGFYGLVERYAARRAAAQSLHESEVEAQLKERIARLMKPLHDREAIVFLFASGRYQMPEPY